MEVREGVILFDQIPMSRAALEIGHVSRSNCRPVPDTKDEMEGWMAVEMARGTSAVSISNALQ